MTRLPTLKKGSSSQRNDRYATPRSRGYAAPQTANPAARAASCSGPPNLVDFYLSDQVLALGGLMVFDDLWMPSIRSVISFIERNRAYERLPSKVGNIAVFRKQQNDTRDWQHFVSFDASARRRSFLRRVLVRLQSLLR